MAEATDLENTKSARAKNNLNKFDINQIEADLLAVEAETLNLDPQAKRNIARDNQKKRQADQNEVENIVEQEPSNGTYRAREVNVVDFNPDNSQLLHRILRSSEAPVNKKSRPLQDSTKQTSGKNKGNLAKPKKPSLLQFKVKPSQKKIVSEPKTRSMDGINLKKSSNTLSTVNSPINVTAVALTGLKKANQFNQFSLSRYKSSLHNQIEKSSIFENSLKGDIEVYEHKIETKPYQKVYNLKQKKAMLGGVDHHNLGPGRAKRMLSNRSVKFLLPVLMLPIVAGYVMYLNMPNISLKMAENRAGISISQPTYAPDGFKLSGPIEASTGEIAMVFKSGDVSYEVAQRVSDWNSKALLENKVLKETEEYSAYADRGLTIYVYDGKAVWVNQGKINEIKLGSSSLDTEEMIRIAGSM